MEIGSITEGLDVAQIVLYGFWIFFVGLLLYLRREDKREGYPLDSDLTDRTGGRVVAVGYPSMPDPKTFRLPDGSVVEAPRAESDERELKAEPVGLHPGAPLRPVGDPMSAEVGPGAYALRADTPDLTIDGEPKIVPLRVATEFMVEGRDPDPRGMEVIGGDGVAAGKVTDVWVDRMEHLIRYLEVEPAGGGATVLVPMPFAKVHRPRHYRPGTVKVKALFASQFASVPALANPDRITLLEEEKVSAYFGAGTLYATPARTESLL